ncbi:MAG: SDR family NAD(P)-dependent oxidoreductase [Candidatus Lokiarchaeota archaeon]|nr:SDR family NAD(P)-dependent oxidoreductase [Candidatus Lokiarchaeota archaeon]
MDLKNKSIAVTGAAGFIGSNLVDHLLEMGADVVGIDNLFNGRLENLESALKSKQFRFYKGDIRDLNFLLEVTTNIDVLFHEAAFTSVPQSILMPESCNDINVKGVLNVLNAARKNDIEKVLFASSASVYGDTPVLPKREDMKREPKSPYGVSKMAGEAYMQVYYTVYGIKTTSLRYFNVFGPRQKDSPYSGVIAIWLGKILRNENLIIFGDGENSRDFTYVKDVIKANILAAEHDAKGEIMNVSCNNPISLTNLAKLMLKITDKQELKIEFADPRPGDILHSYGDISLAKKDIQFEPDYDQESGLKEYLTWYKNKYKVDLNIIQ